MTTCWPKGIRHVDEWGAKARPFHDLTPITAAERTQNVAAINAALEEMRVVRDDTGATPKMGGTLLAGPGVYYVNGAFGYDLAEDVNIGVTLQGLGPFPTLFMSNNDSELIFKLHTTVGNIRMFYMNDVAFYGGRTGMSLVRACYNRFNKVFFWGSRQFGLSDYLGSGNNFSECYSTDSSQLGGGAAIFIGSADTIANWTLGESSGAVIVLQGGLQVDGGYGYGMFHRSTPFYTDYWTTPGSPVDVSLAFFAGDEAAFIGSGCDLMFSNLRFTVAKKFVSLSGCQDVIFTGCQLIAGDSTVAPGASAFEGFVDFKQSFGGTALSINGGTFTFHPGTNGYFIRESAGKLHDAVISTMLVREGNAVITPLGVSAPALLNPSGQDNLLTLRTFQR